MVWKQMALEDYVNSSISTHAGNASAHHNKYTDAEALAEIEDNWIFSKTNHAQLPTNGGWTDQSTDNGSFAQQAARILCLMSGVTTPHSYAAGSSEMAGWTDSNLYYIINYEKPIVWQFQIGRYLSDANVISRILIRGQAYATGDLNIKGFGLKIVNLALYGQSYGTGLANLNLNTTLTSSYNSMIKIVLDPTSNTIKWYVNNVLKGTQSNSANVPQGFGVDQDHMIFIHERTAGVATSALSIMNIHLWQKV